MLMDREPEPDLDSPEAMLDAFRAHPGWTERERDEFLGRLVERFPAGRVVDAVRGRLGDLAGAEAEPVLRLAETYPDPALLDDLAGALERQTGLAPERAWEALAVLEGAGVLERFPSLAERWEELNELFEELEEDAIGQLVEQIEGEPEGVWLALQGLGAVEPEVRPQIVAGLAGRAPGPALVEFLRYLSYVHDTPTRDAALEVLRATGPDDPAARSAWRDLAENHPDTGVADDARRRLGGTGSGSTALAMTASSAGVLARPVVSVVRALVTAVDGRGRGTVVLSALRGVERVTAGFVCDVGRGVVEVYGDVGPDSQQADAAFEEMAGSLGPGVVEGAYELALGLLAGSLMLCGPDAPPALRYWVEGTAGPGFRPQPFRAEFPWWEPDSLPFDEMPERSRALLDACPDWLDRSDLTFELAEEISLREPGSPPDPRRDAGAYRFLFEHRLRGRLECYRRMLLWMAWFWRASGDDDRARTALALAWQLSDPQHVVPGHPFTVELSTRSLAAAQERLGGGERRGRGGR
jgi:hypothetical protein